jgi:hypothetical protein
MTDKCYWFLLQGGKETRLAHFCASLNQRTIFSKEAAPTAVAFCCGKRVDAPAQNRFFGSRLPREEYKKIRLPLSAMRRDANITQ